MSSGGLDAREAVLVGPKLKALSMPANRAQIRYCSAAVWTFFSDSW